jgi:hypothetical protein
MGKVFEVEPFRHLPGYTERVQEWDYEGNLSYFDLSQWMHEWFGESDFSYGVDSGTIEAACEFRSKLIRAVDQLFRIMDRSIERGNRFQYEIARSIQAEITPEIDLIDEWLWEG